MENVAYLIVFLAKLFVFEINFAFETEEARAVNCLPCILQSVCISNREVTHRASLVHRSTA